MTLDPTRLVVKDRPKEWGDLSDELLEFLEPVDGIMNKLQQEVLNKVLASQWFLVRNDLKASSPYGKTEYLTMAGVEVPFNGMTALILFLQEYDEQTRTRLISAMSAGTIVEISEDRAKKNIARIQAKGHTIYPTIM